MILDSKDLPNGKVTIQLKEGVQLVVNLLHVSKDPYKPWKPEHGYRGADVFLRCQGEVHMNCNVLGRGPTYYSSFQSKDTPTVVSVFPKK